MKLIKLWTDGSCNPNPGPGGWAAIIISDKPKQELCGGELDTTNNRMELLAVINGLQAIEEPPKVIVYTDSQLTMNCATGRWRRRKNHDLWKEYDAVAVRHDVHFQKVKGHSNVVLNERADVLANQGHLMVLGEVAR